MLYTIVADANHYRSLIWDDAQITRLVGEADMELRIDMWNSPRSYENVFNETLKVSFKPQSKAAEQLLIPDISVFQGRLFLSPKAYNILEPIIKDDGEFLPVVYEQGDAYIFTPLNIAEKINGLDKKLSRKNAWGDLENLAFHENRVKGWSLFRCEFDTFMSLQCRPDVRDAIGKADLKGVFFTEDLGNIFSNQFDDNIRDAN